VEPQVLSIGDALGRIARGRESFRVHIVGLGAFPRLKQARVLWIGLQDDGNRLVSLAQSIEQSLEPLGFPKEKRNFSPHLTLGRVRARLSEDFVAHFRDLHFDAGAFTAERVCLMRSQLKPSGAVYSEMAAFSLKQD